MYLIGLISILIIPLLLFIDSCIHPILGVGPNAKSKSQKKEISESKDRLVDTKKDK